MARTISARQEEELNAYQSNGPLADLWAEFAMNGTPPTLAKYLLLGGEVDMQVRRALIALLQDMDIGNPGGAKPWRDYATFTAAEAILFSDRLARRFGNQQGTKTLSKRGAVQLYSKAADPNLRTFELQYDRGKRVFPNQRKSLP